MTRKSPATIRVKMRFNRFLRKYGGRIGFYFAGVVVLVILAAWIFPPLKYYFTDIFKVREFRILNVYYNNPAELQQALAPFLGRSYWDLDKKAVKKTVEAVPWVDHASVRALPGSRVTVVVTEKQPVALFRTKKGDIWIVDGKGSRIAPFTPDFSYRNFPLIDCDRKKLPFVVHKLEKMKTVDNGIFFNRLSELVVLKNNEKWECFLRDIPWKIYVDPFGSFKNVRQFLKVEKFIKSRYDNVEYIDLSFRHEIVVKPE
ncbi:MAG: FtsQ-type POTRA domain-containing protein [Acidobacteria bacterium]|nr:FtsQ-type POTRA domain-containing protein [Acidobacteriota bacterium]